jgi:hypothetical protein
MDGVTESTTGSTPDAETRNTQPAAGDGGRPGPSRGRPGLRDMLLSMIALALLVLAISAVTKSCSFSPGGPSTSGAVTPTVDMPAEFRSGAGQVGFPLRQPAVPAGWRPNSASVTSVPTSTGGPGSAMRLGLITPDGHYLEVVQSNADDAALVRFLAGLPADASVAPQGTTNVDGTVWTSYPGVRAEVAWVTDVGPVRLLVTGDGTPAQFRVLASAIRSAPIVPAPGSPTGTR